MSSAVSHYHHKNLTDWSTYLFTERWVDSDR